MVSYCAPNSIVQTFPHPFNENNEKFPEVIHTQYSKIINRLSHIRNAYALVNGYLGKCPEKKEVRSQALRTHLIIQLHRQQ